MAVLLSAGCARPAKKPSPFDSLALETPEKRVLPAGPVQGPDFEIMPDAELVYGPSLKGFDTETIVEKGSRLSGYSEEVDEKMLSGIQILEKVSRDYSVSPLLLLALLEYQAGWVSGMGLVTEYPLNPSDTERAGLFRQLSWVANELNRGFYSRRVGGLKSFQTRDGVEVIVSPEINDASAAVQYLLARVLGYHEWLDAVSPLGLYAGYLVLSGLQSAGETEAFHPDELVQPPMALPFAEGWFFTSGPHSAWGDGAAWAAMDFAPDEENYGCYDSEAWVLAAADGWIVRSVEGVVVQDLDKDQFEGSGWTIIYMHIASRDRVNEGEYLQAGERVGHPSCEGGPATGTHLHLARRYNGEWIPADQTVPFDLSGWVSSGAGVEYDGALARGGQIISASGFPTDENKVYP